MMTYEQIDPVIEPWAEKHNLKLYKKDRDWDVRSFLIDGSCEKGWKFHIWIETPDSEGRIKVNFKKLKTMIPVETQLVKIDELERTLEDVFSKTSRK